MATVDDDGTIVLLGGSQAINTGGEGVPEEWRGLKSHPRCTTLVVGVPDEQFGEQVCAVRPGLGGPLRTRHALPGRRQAQRCP
jgi:non-ribosomal peptide synthetase component E (peptide arylation enzyme)